MRWHDVRSGLHGVVVPLAPIIRFFGNYRISPAGFPTPDLMSGCTWQPVPPPAPRSMNLGSWVKHASEMDEMGNMNGEEALPAIQTRHFRRQCIRSVPDLAVSAHVRRPHRYTTDGTECTQPRLLERQLWKELLVICSCSSRYCAVLPALNVETHGILDSACCTGATC